MENFRVNIEGRRPDNTFGITTLLPMETYDTVMHTFDIEAEGREQAKAKGVERAEEETDDERYSYRALCADRKKPRSSQNYETPKEVWE